MNIEVHDSDSVDDKETPKDIAVRLLDDAARRAPSFVFMRIIFYQSLDMEDMTEEERSVVKQEAIKLMTEEDKYFCNLPAKVFTRKEQ